MHMSGVQINNLHFANNTALLAESQNELQASFFFNYCLQIPALLEFLPWLFSMMGNVQEA